MENTAKKRDITHRSKRDRSTNDCKTLPDVKMDHKKIKSNYTIKRNEQDLENINIVKTFLKNCVDHRILQFNFQYNSFNTDSETYRALPQLFMNTVKTIVDQDILINELQSKEADLVEIRRTFCSLLDKLKLEETN